MYQKNYIKKSILGFVWTVDHYNKNKKENKSILFAYYPDKFWSDYLN